MKNRISSAIVGLVPLALLLSPLGGVAQVPVDDDGNVIGTYDDGSVKTYSSEPAIGNEGIPLLSAADLEELVGPIALYPDDLLAVVLPAATYPLQVVQAARFLEDLESDPSLKPDQDWDDSIVALVNYPEVVELLNEDLDWTWRLGEAVVAQQADVVNAVEDFRNRAYAAGNLKSDNHQTVTRDEGIIEITPVNEEVIYVPYYEPTRVVYYQPRPVYHYYPRPCPVYYYPYSSNHAFNRGYFWGVTTAFSIGWRSDHLRVFHHSYHGHPYYGRSYWDRWWYRRPSIHVHNNVYINNNRSVSVNRYRSGDYWRPSRNTRLRASDQRITRSTHYPRRQTSSNTTSFNRSTNRTVNNSRAANSNRQVTNRQATIRPASNQRHREDLRRTHNNVSRESITALQRQRRSQTGDNDGTRQRQTSQRQASQDRSSQRGIIRRQSREPRPELSSSNGQRQRVAVADQRRQTFVPQPTRQASTSTQRRTQPAQSVQHQSQSTRRESQPTQRQAQPTSGNSQRAQSSQDRSESSSQQRSSQRGGSSKRRTTRRR